MWAGRAVCLLKVTHNGAESELALIQMGSNDQTVQDYLGYKFTFNLMPYPEAGKSIDSSDYRLAMKVTAE